MYLTSIGFNSTLRQGYITHHEYIQVGKGRDVGMNQISLFEAKVANGNGEQTLSRDVYRLGRRFDFYRMMSFYFTTVGFYFSSMVINQISFWGSYLYSLRLLRMAHYWNAFCPIGVYGVFFQYRTNLLHTRSVKYKIKLTEIILTYVCEWILLSSDLC